MFFSLLFLFFIIVSFFCFVFLCCLDSCACVRWSSLSLNEECVPKPLAEGTLSEGTSCHMTPRRHAPPGRSHHMTVLPLSLYHCSHRQLICVLLTRLFVLSFVCLLVCSTLSVSLSDRFITVSMAREWDADMSWPPPSSLLPQPGYWLSIGPGGRSAGAPVLDQS